MTDETDNPEEEIRINLRVEDVRQNKDSSQQFALSERLKNDKVDTALVYTHKLLGDYVACNPQELNIQLVDGKVGEGTVKGTTIELQLPDKEQAISKMRNFTDPLLYDASEENKKRKAEDLAIALTASDALHEGVHALLNSKPDSMFSSDFEAATGFPNEQGKASTLLDEGLAYAIQGIYAPVVEPLGSLAPISKETEDREVRQRKLLGEKLRPMVKEYIDNGKRIDTVFFERSKQMIIDVQTIPTKEAERVLSIDEIVEISDEEEYKKARDFYIEKRLDTLQDTVKPKIFTAYSPPYKGLIHPDSEIKPAAFLDGFKVDDKAIYTSFVDNIHVYKSVENWKTKSVREINPYAILKTVGEYFGNYLADGDLENRHHFFYQDHSSVDSEALSLEELKGQGIAMCTEKAAVTQNLVVFTGIESELCLSQDCELLPGQKEMHAFNLLKSDRGRFIFEPTNPVVVTDTEDNIVNYLPAIYPITDEQYDKLITGGKIEVQHNDYQVDEGKYKIQETTVRKYAGMSKPTI